MHDINILFVEDEPDTRLSLERFLRKEPFVRFYAENGSQALDILARTHINILVTDMKMPEMDGLTLLKKVKERYPDTIRLALSAYTMAGQLLPTINSGGIFRYITKPIEPSELRTALNDAVDFYLMQKERQTLVQELKQKNQALQEALDRQSQIEQQLRKLAITDELTGLYNRRYLTLSLEREFEQNKRYGTDCSLIVIELDQLDVVKRIHGSAVAEQVLREFSKRLTSTLRSADMGFRCEESFYALLPNTPYSKAFFTAERIMDICRKTPFRIRDGADTITANAGVVCLEHHSPPSPQAMLEMAHII